MDSVKLKPCIDLIQEFKFLHHIKIGFFPHTGMFVMQQHHFGLIGCCTSLKFSASVREFWHAIQPH